MSWVVRPLTLMRWTGILPFRVISFQTFNPVPFHTQDIVTGPKPRCIQGEELWNALPISDKTIGHMIKIRGGIATQGGYVFDAEGRLIKEASHKHRNHFNWGLSDQKNFEYDQITKFQGTVVVLTASNQQIYWHWIFEVLPRLAMLRESAIKTERIYIQSCHRFQQETLRLFGTHSNEIFIDCDQLPIISASTLVVPCHQIMEGREYPRWLCHFLRESFLPHARDRATRHRRIYISRKNTHHRRVTNEKKIVSILKEYGFISVNLEELSFIEQVSLFQNAEVVIGPHGGGLANLVFCSKGTRVIEFFPAATADALFRLSKAVELEYYFLRSRIGNPRDWGMSDYSIDRDDLRETLKLAGVHP